MVSKEQLRQFIRENDLKSTEDVQTALRDLFASTMQEMLAAELETALGYATHDTKNQATDNSRNGHSRKTLTSEYGDVEIAVSRDRQGEFEPEIIKKHPTNTAGIEEQIIAMYARGVSTRDIQSHRHELYGLDVSPTLISNITDKLLPHIKEWQSRPLAKVYAVVYLDAMHDKVKQEGRVINKAAYMVVGIDLEGCKDVLGMWIGENESSKFWLTVLNELKSRGVEDILIICVDNLKGFSEAISACYPNTDIQKCVVHQIRNSLKYVSYKDYKAVTADLKPIYKASTEEAARAELDKFEEAWGAKYPTVIRSWRNNWDELATFFRYPVEMRKLIYTTNMIESYHRQLRKVTKGKSIFPTDDSLTKMLYLATMEVTKRWTMRVQNWGQILSQLSIYFGERLDPYINS
jgi:transposase-like protein